MAHILSLLSIRSIFFYENKPISPVILNWEQSYQKQKQIIKIIIDFKRYLKFMLSRLSLEQLFRILEASLALQGGSKLKNKDKSLFDLDCSF